MTRTTLRTRVAATALATSLMVFIGIAGASPASAAPVGDFATLQTEFGGSGTSTLTASINSPSSELVLADGATQVLALGAFNLTVHNIILGAGSSLTITGTTGILTADASDIGTGGFYWDARAGIAVPATASLVIAGGVVHATGGGIAAAGIGAHSHGTLFDGPGSISITGGTVVAVGSEIGAGIGGSAVLPTGQGSISISGGNVTATAGSGSGASGIGGGWYSHVNSISITGGVVNATGSDNGAGIGGGEGGGGAGTISIGGGTVTANAGEFGAAIGSGAYFGGTSGSGSISITAGTITATAPAGSYGAAIGSGYNNSPVPVSISGGTITATSNDGAGIGGGQSSANGTITITGGTFDIFSEGGAGIGSGFFTGAGTIDISAGTFDITADGGGAAIGGGLLGASSSITLSGGTFTLVSNTLAPVIGSGVAGGDGGTITIGNGVIVSVSTDQTQTVVGGTSGTATITLNGRLTILQGTLIAPVSGGLTIGATGVLRGPGGLSGSSPVINNGSITGSVNVTATDVQVNNFLVTYSPDAGTGYAGGTQRVYATSFANAELALADPVTGYDAAWYDAPVAGALFTTATVLAGDITLFPLFSVEALAATGVETLVLLPIALLVLVLGAVLVLLRRQSAF